MQISDKDLNVILYGSDSVRETFIECKKIGFLFPFIPFVDISAYELFQISHFSVFGFPFTHYVSGFEIEIKDSSNIQVLKYGGTMYKTNTGFNITPIFVGSKIHQITDVEKHKFFTNLWNVQIKLRWLSIKLLPPKQIYMSDLRKNKNFKYIIKQGEDIYTISEEFEEGANELAKLEIPKDINKLERLFFKKAIVEISIETELTRAINKCKNLFIISEKKFFLCLSLNE